MRMSTAGLLLTGLLLASQPGVLAQTPSTPSDTGTQNTTRDSEPKSPRVELPACDITFNSTRPGNTVNRPNTSVVAIDSTQVNSNTCPVPYIPETTPPIK